jgi:hypothetical protein
MNRFLSQEVLRMLGIIGLAGLSIMTVLGVYINRVRGSFAPYRKATILYLLLSLPVCALVGLAGHSSLPFTPTWRLIAAQAAFFLIGLLHIYCMHRFLKWSQGEKSFWMELLFTIVVAAFGFMIFVVVYHALSKDGFHYAMASSVLFMPIAFLTYTTFLKAIDIPLKIYARWFYPVHEEVADPDEAKLKNILVISFEFQKKMNDPHFTNFRAKAPADMEFGQLFYYFINDYNERHPNGKIEYVNGKGDPYGWIFYRKPRWYHFRTRYMDTDKTFFINHVRENDIIVCKRV